MFTNSSLIVYAFQRFWCSLLVFAYLYCFYMIRSFFGGISMVVLALSRIWQRFCCRPVLHSVLFLCAFSLFDGFHAFSIDFRSLMDADGSLWGGLWCSPWILAGGLRPPDPPPGELRTPGPPEVRLSYAPHMGVTCQPL